MIIAFHNIPYFSLFWLILGWEQNPTLFFTKLENCLSQIRIQNSLFWMKCTVWITCQVLVPGRFSEVENLKSSRWISAKNHLHFGGNIQRMMYGRISGFPLRLFFYACPGGKIRLVIKAILLIWGKLFFIHPKQFSSLVNVMVGFPFQPEIAENKKK